MSTTSVPTSLRKQPSYVLRRLSIVVFLVALSGLMIVVGYLYSMARGALPQVDGALVVPGLAAPVNVTRDLYGIPTIDAANLNDLFLAQGYITAQDRLWQMDAMRAFAAGELAEILGPGSVEHDREQRILGLSAIAHHSLELASAQDRLFLEAYANGVNAFVKSRNGRLPLEFRILHYAPKPWAAEDSLLMGANMVKDLNHGYYRAALEKEKILAKLGPELTADLYVNSSWHDRPPVKGPARLDDLEDEEDEDAPEDNAITRLFSAASADRTGGTQDPFYLFRPGSNNWVVAGAHTVSGKPLLSNDMHLDHQMPNLWYEVHLRCRGFDVLGFTLPGTPFVIVGHNQRIGWGFTNVGPIVEDLYVETLNDRGQYRTPQGWRDPEHRKEVIHVKGQPDQNVDVSITRHGPIIRELIPGEKRALALRWTLYDGLKIPFFDIDSAQNWDEFTQGLSKWGSPAQNAVYADIDGHIGYHATGNIPIRASGDGSLPENGSDDAHEWKGYVPFDKLPKIFDPPWGVIATANGRITPDKYSFSISTQWDAPWRTERIYHVLESGKKFSAADMLALQTDVYSAFDRFCAERFVYAMDHANHLSSKAKQARDLMRDWDGRLTKESAAATVENKSRNELVRLILEDKLGAESKDPETLSWKDYRWFMSSVWLEQVLLKQPKRWLPRKYPNYDYLLTTAVESAVNEPAAPANLADWRWGEASPLLIQHPVLGHIPIVRHWTGPGLVEQAGGNYTVKQAAKDLGPSERMTVDFSDFDRSTFNTVTGQSGNFLSPYYMDQWKAWYEGTTMTIPFSPSVVDQGKRHKLILKPS